jgi:UDP-2-acetamido-3-amino-2,3-dideoxy-glucuronate N-acetyltransferase
MVGHLLWYHPAFLKLKALIDSGELGSIRYIYSNRLNFGKVRQEENVLWSFAPHDISMMLGILQEMPSEVQVHGGSYLQTEIADVTVSTFSFPSGVKAHIFVSWLHPFKEHKLVVVGDKKMAVFDDTQKEDKLRLYPYVVKWENQTLLPSQSDVTPVPVENTEPLRAECLHFLECLKERRTPRTDGEEGLRVLRVLNQLQKALKLSHPKMNDSVFVHESSIVDSDVEIGEGTFIWHFSHILRGSRIGKNCRIGQNVVIGPNVYIGDGVKIQNNVSVYEGVTLEDYVFCGPSVVFTNVVNPRSEIPRMKELKPTYVKKGATLGANSTILCGITIGMYGFVGAGAVVTRDVPDYALVVGNPARTVGWMCRCGLKLSWKGKTAVCSCGLQYEKTKKGAVVQT